MHPTTFHPNERVLSPPSGQHEDVSGLRVLDAVYEDGSPIVISCWELTDEDLERIQNTGKIYIAVMGNRHPPILPTVNPEDVGI